MRRLGELNGKVIIEQPTAPENKYVIWLDSTENKYKEYKDGYWVESDQISTTGQVQSDWNEDDDKSPAYIRNKPGIPTVVNVNPVTVSDSDIYFLPEEWSILQELFEQNKIIILQFTENDNNHTCFVNYMYKSGRMPNATVLDGGKIKTLGQD